MTKVLNFVNFMQYTQSNQIKANNLLFNVYFVLERGKNHFTGRASDLMRRMPVTQSDTFTRSKRAIKGPSSAS